MGLTYNLQIDKTINAYQHNAVDKFYVLNTASMEENRKPNNIRQALALQAVEIQ